MEGYYLTNTNRTEILRELKSYIESLREDCTYDFSLLSDSELQAVTTLAGKTIELLDGFKKVTPREGTDRIANIQLLKRMAIIFKYQNLDLDNLESLTDGQVWMHLQKLKTIQNHRMAFRKELI